MKHRKVGRIDLLSPATHDFQYYGRLEQDIHFNIIDVFNAIVVLAFLALLILYPNFLYVEVSSLHYAMFLFSGKSQHAQRVLLDDNDSVGATL